MKQDLSVNEPIRENTEFESTKSWVCLSGIPAFLAPIYILDQITFCCCEGLSCAL